MLKTLAVVRAVVFALLLAYTLYALPWKYLDLVFFPRDGVLLANGDVLTALKTLMVATCLGVAWIGVDTWLSFALLRKQGERGARASGSPEPAK
jgi:hypothetical protein